MADPAAGRSTRRPVDETALAHQLRRLRRAAAPPWLHGEVARRMVGKLDVIRSQPAVVLDWWSQLGASRRLLQQTYPAARLVAVEPVVVQTPAPWWSPRRWSGRGPETMAAATLPAAGAQLVWANMVLHFAADPQAQFESWRDALAVDGFLMFSTLGPGTLEALSALYRRAGWPPPFAPFVDMHDLGDLLVHAGFADPVMDQETITLTWPDANALLAELHALGGNLDPARHAGLRTPRWRQQLADALMAGAGAGGRPALAFEIVYGHAFKPRPKMRIDSETRIGIEAMRATLRDSRNPR